MSSGGDSDELEEQQAELQEQIAKQQKQLATERKQREDKVLTRLRRRSSPSPAASLASGDTLG